jgi:hypothetical protein
MNNPLKQTFVPVELPKFRAEGEKKSIINIVFNCRRNGFSIEQMLTITGLSEEEMQEILRSTPV